MKNTTIHIDSDRRPRHSVTGWPTVDMGESYPVVAEQEKALAKAVSEALYFEDEYAVKRLLLDLVDWAPESIVDTHWQSLDTAGLYLLFEIEADVEVVYQRDFSSDYKKGPRWGDVTKDAYDHYHGPYAQRTVARIKKAENSAHGYTEGAEIPQMPADEKKWREDQHDNDKKLYSEQDKLFGVIMHGLLMADVAPIDCDEIATAMMPYIDQYLLEKLAAAESRIKELEEMPRLQWNDGYPPHPYSEEWFIAKTQRGQKVVLTALPKEFSYDFKTADDTYMMADKVKQWMQFPDSEYKPFEENQIPRG